MSVILFIIPYDLVAPEDGHYPKYPKYAKFLGSPSVKDVDSVEHPS